MKLIYCVVVGLAAAALHGCTGSVPADVPGETSRGVDPGLDGDGRETPGRTPPPVAETATELMTVEDGAGLAARWKYGGPSGGGNGCEGGDENCNQPPVVDVCYLCTDAHSIAVVRVDSVTSVTDCPLEYRRAYYRYGLATVSVVAGYPAPRNFVADGLHDNTQLVAAGGYMLVALRRTKSAWMVFYSIEVIPQNDPRFALTTTSRAVDLPSTYEDLSEEAEVVFREYGDFNRCPDHPPWLNDDAAYSWLHRPADECDNEASEPEPGAEETDGE